MNYLKRARVAAGLSQRDVSNKMGYSTPQFISNWERGVSLPPMKSFKKLASILKIKEEDIAEFCFQHDLKELRKKYKLP